MKKRKLWLAFIRICVVATTNFENTDPKQILEDGSTDRENYIDGKEEENDEQLFRHLCELSFGGFNLNVLFVYISLMI